MTSTRPYRIFNVALARSADLSAHLRRLTFAGSEIADMTTLAPDQRIKIFFPGADGLPPALPATGDWYKDYKALPVAQRVPMRSYTIRQLRASACELDVDFVLHGETGPASRWALHARPGDRLQMSAPNRHAQGEIGGYEWKPPASARHILLAADETALPALSGILEQLAGRADKPHVQAYVEVPSAQGQIELPHWPGLSLRWLPRDAAGAATRPGELLLAAIRTANLPQGAVTDGLELEDIDIDRVVPWEQARAGDGDFYAWIAAESAAVMALRTFLVRERGLDRRALNLMGYWRLGKVFE
jgi:NADPH-dependent ferric siderophore reductase